MVVIADFKLPLAPVRALSIASRANAYKGLHALWRIRTPRSSCANQDAAIGEFWHVDASRWHTHASRNITPNINGVA